MRYNMFNQIHKALRVLMYDTATLISQTDFDDTKQEEAVKERLSLVLDLFDKHAHHEDTMVLPMIEQYEPAVVDAFEQEHVTDHELAQRLKGFIMALNYAISSEAKKDLGSALSISFMEFMVFNLQHMKKEETVLNHIFWRYYSDEELIGVSQKIAASIPAEEAAISAKWMMKGLSNHEITAWLRNVERNAPNHVFRPLFTTAEKELEQSRFREVLNALTDGVKKAS
ncbi:MAG: hemerythrin domain-containing protein [Bacteroidota bacterium]